MELISSPDIFIAPVKAMRNHVFKDPVPNIQVSPLSLEIETTPFHNPVAYVDHTGFSSQFGTEVQQIAKMEAIVERGQHFVHMLYTFRSVSRAIPMVVSMKLFLYYFYICILIYYKL
jgi:cytoplasmic FMR1 interacting protein